MKKYRFGVLVAAWIVAGVLMIAGAQTGEGKAEFARTTIDLGAVVSDIDEATEFYTEAIGFEQVGSFDVSAELAEATGLTDAKPFQVRVFALGKEPTATKLKLMEIPGAGSKPIDNEYISSSLGFSYLTIVVADLDEAMARLEREGVSPVKPPYKLGGNRYLILVKDPDGNIVELIGPKK